MNHVNDLPDEVLMRVFEFLRIEDRKCAASVCSLWYNILHCARFQRQCKYGLYMTFEEEITEVEKKVLQHCRNLVIMHRRDEEDNENQQDKEEVIQVLRYLFKPTPEKNLTDLLFGNELYLESLCLYITFDNCREIIEQRLPQLKHLQQLNLSFIRTKKQYFEDLVERELSFDEVEIQDTALDSPIWIIEHPRLQYFKIDMVLYMKPFHLIAPQLTTLELPKNCRWNNELIETHSSHLQCLKLEFKDAGSMDQFMTMCFPKLTQLYVQWYDDKEAQLEYARLNKRLIDEEKNENFVRGMPLLRGLELGSNLMFYRMGPALTKYSWLLEDLTLRCLELEHMELRLVELLPALEILSLHHCRFVDPSPKTPILQLPKLPELVEANTTISFNNFIALRYLYITICAYNNHKVMNKVCANLPSLEYLDVLFSQKMKNTALRNLNRLTKLLTFKLSCYHPLNERIWVHCPIVSSVQSLIIYRCTCKLPTLQPMAQLFPSVREVYVDDCFLRNCDHEDFLVEGYSDDEDVENDMDEIVDETLVNNRMRSWFPQSKVSITESRFCPKCLK